MFFLRAVIVLTGLEYFNHSISTILRLDEQVFTQHFDRSCPLPIQDYNCSTSSTTLPVFYCLKMGDREGEPDPGRAFITLPSSPSRLSPLLFIIN